MTRDGEPEERHTALRASFEAAADSYDGARPDYPPELFDDLVALARLRAGNRLLEIGCATGKASRPLLERGLRVVAVELGANLAEHARRQLAGLPFEVHVASFEEWHPECDDPFDLVFAATAWHWVDPTVRYRKAYDLLRPGGHLAFWSALHAFPAGFDPFFAEIQEVYDEIGESREDDWPPPEPEELPDDRAEIEATRLFEDVSVKRYVWERRYSADEYVALLDTFSGHISMEEWKRSHLYAEIRRRLVDRGKPRVRRHWYAILHVARRVANAPPA